MTSILASTFWEQNRLVVAAVLTLGIIVLVAIVYALTKQGPRLTTLLQSGKLVSVMQAYRVALGGAALVVFVLSFLPRASSGMGGLLYFFLWPLVAVQFGLSFLPWQRMIQRDPGAAVALACFISFLAFCIDRMMLQLAGYLT